MILTNWREKFPPITTDDRIALDTEAAEIAALVAQGIEQREAAATVLGITTACPCLTVCGPCGNCGVHSCCASNDGGRGVQCTIDGRFHECGCRLEECVERRAAS